MLYLWYDINTTRILAPGRNGSREPSRMLTVLVGAQSSARIIVLEHQVQYREPGYDSIMYGSSARSSTVLHTGASVPKPAYHQVNDLPDIYPVVFASCEFGCA